MELALPGRYDITASIRGTLSTAPGVLLGADGRQFAVARDQRNGPSCIRQHAPNSSWGPWAAMS